MLKYLYHSVVFSEIPDEISLGISVSGCQIHCKSCHSRELWEDKGTPLTIQELDKLIKENKGISCLLILGGERNIPFLKELFLYCKKNFSGLKTAWYSGLDHLPERQRDILNVLNYYKEGHYDPDLGGLDSPATNQHLYLIEHQGNDNFWKSDITYKLQKHN